MQHRADLNVFIILHHQSQAKLFFLQVIFDIIYFLSPYTVSPRSIIFAFFLHTLGITKVFLLPCSCSLCSDYYSSFGVLPDEDHSTFHYLPEIQRAGGVCQSTSLLTSSCSLTASICPFPFVPVAYHIHSTVALYPEEAPRCPSPVPPLFCSNSCSSCGFMRSSTNACAPVCHARHGLPGWPRQKSRWSASRTACW